VSIEILERIIPGYGIQLFRSEKYSQIDSIKSNFKLPVHSFLLALKDNSIDEF